MTRNSALFTLPIFLLLLSNCASDSDNQENVESALEDQLTEEAYEPEEESKEELDKAREIYYSLPSPLETSRMLKVSGARFSSDMLHNTEESKKYTTSRAKALNLGIYLADLSYCNVFHRQQQCIDYFAVTKDLGDGLGMSQVFTNEALDRVNENLNNQDSVFRILSELYWKANDEMKENQLKSVNARVMAGLWIEGMHIGLNSYASAKEKKDILRQRIVEQQFVLNELLPMIASMNTDDDLDAIVNDLANVQAIFDKFKVDEEEPIIMEGEDGNAVIGGDVEVSADDSLIEELAATIATIRKKYTSQA